MYSRRNLKPLVHGYRFKGRDTRSVILLVSRGWKGLFKEQGVTPYPQKETPLSILLCCYADHSYNVACVLVSMESVHLIHVSVFQR